MNDKECEQMANGRRRCRRITNRCFLGNIDFTVHKCEKRNGVDATPLGMAPQLHAANGTKTEIF